MDNGQETTMADTLHTIVISAFVMHDLESRILQDVRDENPNVVITTNKSSHRSTIVTVTANVAGLEALRGECAVTADNWRGEYQWDRSDQEARRTWQTFAKAEARLAELLSHMVSG
jgi:hypothetical protein